MHKALTLFDVILIVCVLAVFSWSLTMVLGRDAPSPVIEEFDGSEAGDAGGSGSLPAGDDVVEPGQPAAIGSDLTPILATRVSRGYPWELIIVHHTDGARGSAATLQTAARVPHFVVGNGSGLEEGGIEPTTLWLDQQPGTHVGAAHVDRRAIGVSLVGDFTLRPPSAAQLDSTVMLVASLCRQHGIPPAAVAVHREVGAFPTACPGDSFPVETFREKLEDTLRR